MYYYTIKMKYVCLMALRKFKHAVVSSFIYEENHRDFFTDTERQKKRPQTI